MVKTKQSTKKNSFDIYLNKVEKEGHNQAKMLYLADCIEKYLRERKSYNKIKIQDNIIKFSYRGHVFYLEVKNSKFIIDSSSQIYISDARNLIEDAIILNYTQHKNIFFCLDKIIDRNNDVGEQFIVLKNVFMETLQTHFKNYKIKEIIGESTDRSFLVSIQTENNKSCLTLQVQNTKDDKIIVTINNQSNYFNTKNYDKTNPNHYLWWLLTKQNNSEKIDVLFDQDESWDYDRFYLYLPSLLNLLESIIIPDKFSIVENKQLTDLKEFLSFFTEEKWELKNIYTKYKVNIDQKILEIGETFTLNVLLPKEAESEEFNYILLSINSEFKKASLDFNDMTFDFEYEKAEDIFKPLQRLAESLK